MQIDPKGCKSREDDAKKWMRSWGGKEIVRPEQDDPPWTGEELAHGVGGLFVVRDVQVKDVGPRARPRRTRLDATQVDAVLFEHAQDLEEKPRAIGFGLDEKR